MFRQLIAGALAMLAVTTAQAAEVIINGERIDQQTVEVLERAYRTTIESGHYWYDPLSGAWGFVGGPVAGQIAPFLPLGGELRADASNGDTGVFINGRELHALDVARLQQIFGYVMPGRYWVNAQGIGGVEGGPPIFNLNATGSSGGAGSNGYNVRNNGGDLMSDGSCSAYLHPNGTSVMTGC